MTPFKVSIHAPTQGATVRLGEINPWNGVSIHAPTQGATRLPLLCFQPYQSFNPRSHAGSDLSPPPAPLPFSVFQSTLPRRERPFAASSSFALFSVSIHAPTQNPRSHAGSDLSPPPAPLPFSVFQSTLPRRERRIIVLVVSILVGFNPRSHAGSDEVTNAVNGLKESFNPRSHAGSDDKTPVRVPELKMFQSTLPRRERREEITSIKIWVEVSIHAPTQGATEASIQSMCILTVSIHAPTQGATTKNGRCRKSGIVSIHAPTQGATDHLKEVRL